MTHHGIDCFSTILPGMPEQLFSAGYDFFARYYRRAPLEGGRGNALSLSEAKRLFNAGLWALAIYQNTSDQPSYFTPTNAKADAGAALAAAAFHGQPKDTTIYFSVDCNPTQEELPSIISYFLIIREYLWLAGYYTGVYGSGLVCRTLSEEGIVHRTWLANAKGWRGYQDWHHHADVVQTTLPFTLPFGLQVDANVCKDRAQAGMWRPEVLVTTTTQSPDRELSDPRNKSLLSRISAAISRIFGQNP